MALDYFVFDGDGDNLPRRPGSDDVGGYAKEDDQAYPPDPVTMPTASDWNQIARLVLAFGRVCPVLVLSIDFDAGTPFVSGFAAASETLTADDITVTKTGTGVVRIAWPTDTLPPLATQPIAGLTGTTNSATALVILDEANSRMDVKTFDAAGVALDAKFSVMMF